MKFSWTMLNYFINLESITFEKFIDKLTLAGFEVEKIEENTKIADKIIHLSITANRKEIFCVINLAKEIASIFNLSLKINLKQIQLLPNNTTYNFINKSQQILYIRINTISNLSYQKSPQWLQNNLIGSNIKPLFLLHDIQQYIEIKWGHKILIFDLDKLNTKCINFNLLKIDKNITLQKQETIIYNNQELFYLDTINPSNNTTQFSNKTKNIILCCFINNINNLLNSSETFNHAYNETIRLIITHCGGIISKSYQNSRIITGNNKKLKIEKNEIKYILGPIFNQQNKFLSNKNIFKALNQLKLKPYYSYNHKIFEITIPKYREHDLKRSIDIIEEIGRIYGFKYFLNKLPKYNRKGKISIKSFYIKKIRYTLLNLGFDEAINSSLTQKEIYQNNQIKIHNPIAEEQSSLRTNIAKNLIENYKLQIKQKNSRTEIFEIGNIFYKDKQNPYNEQIHLGGIINNLQFLKKDWYSKSNKLEWFHAKGILEFILDTLQTNIQYSKTLTEIDNTKIENIQSYLDPNEKIFIYNKKNNQLIGILGKVNNKYIDYIDQYKKTTYLFEINIKSLIDSIYFNKQISHIIKPYSLYPSVIRDISININKNDNITQIINLLLQKNKNLIEYIEIINEYYNKVTKIKSICLRIIYRSSNRTLDNKDLININNNIKQLLYK
uniref:phenylalanine--tRNA ligase n=1 Tax=Membranoptera platyphylla TaxID=1204437 RepID=A0A1I9KQI4_9FLOR|nr:phenylalanyl-tRNA synthetase beta chain [Membranoptera platyphylla]AMJ16878.1 phenylalanyl-tRNA synthetase beta chain [Membranoptera platyphylla]